MNNNNLLDPITLAMMRAKFVQECLLRGRIKTEEEAKACVAYFNEQAKKRGWTK